MARDCRVDDKASMLCILLRSALKDRLIRSDFTTAVFMLSTTTRKGTPPKNLPRLFQSIDDDVQLLRETHVNVLVAAEAKSDEQRPDQSIPIRLRVVDLPS